MSDWGVFAVARDIWDHPVLSGDKEPFSKREAWMWLVSATTWKPRRVGIDGHIVHLERGELCYSVRFLSQKWHWSKSRVARFLDVLENQDMIRDASRDSVKVYSVTNYNEYQVVGLPNRDSERDEDRDSSGTRAGHERDKEETFKHSNTKKHISVSKRSRKFLNGHADDFEAFYTAFPKHVARGAAEKAYVKALEEASPAQILTGATAYAASRAGEEYKFTKAPSAWLNQKCWLDEIAPSATGPPNLAAEYAVKFAALEKK